MAKSILTVGWLGWGALILLMMAYLSTLPLFGDDMRAAWEWLIPHVLPTMALVAGMHVTGSNPASGPPVSGVGSTNSIIGAIFFSALYLGLLSFSLLSA